MHSFSPSSLLVANFGFAMLDIKSPIKRVIRSRITKMYLAESGTWTSKPEEAKDFAGIEMVISALFKYKLQDCDLVLQLHDMPSREYDVVLPLGTPTGRWNQGEAAKEAE